MKWSYVLPAPQSYRAWDELERDIEQIRVLGYDAVEFQIADPSELDVARLDALLKHYNLPLCAIQTGTTYATRGNCLCTKNDLVWRRTVDLLRSFVELAVRFDAVLVFGSLQGRASDQPDLAYGRARILEALAECGQYAAQQGAVIALEPVNHLEVAYHNTIADVQAVVRQLATPGLRMMIDTFHMNIEEQAPVIALAPIADLLVHVHLSETNRRELGSGHFDFAGFGRSLDDIDYEGYVSVGIYRSSQSQRGCMQEAVQVLQQRGIWRTE